MNKILVSYDLIKVGKDYQSLYDYFDNFDYIKPLRSVYILWTSKPVEKVRDEIINLMDDNDKLFVVDITNSMWGTYNLPKTVEWLNSHE